MLNALKSKLTLLVRTKIGLALVAALLVGGGGTALAATSIPGFGRPLSSALGSALGGQGDHVGTSSDGGHSGSAGESNGSGDAGGEPTATSSTGEQYSTQGTVASLGATSFVVKHNDGSTTVDVDGTTQWKGVSGFGGLTVGVNVSVSGTSNGEGSMFATMVEVAGGSGGSGDGGGGGGGGEPTATPTNTPQSVQGTVASLGDGSFVVKHGDGSTTVDVDGTTQWKGVSGLGGLTVGMTVSVSGSAHGEGTILATMVEASSASGGGGGGGDATPTPTTPPGK